MPRTIRWRVEGVLALLIAAVMVVGGAGALYFFFRVRPVHTDPEAVPSTAVAADAGPHTAAVEKARRNARATLVAGNSPGLSVAVAVNGEIVWAEGFGYVDVDSRTPLTPSTRFHLGSVSKTLTAAALALLHDRGRLDLDAPVQRYVPAYPQKPWTITTRQLMGDVAGVHRIRGDNNDLMPFGHCTSLAEALAMFADEPLLFEPGTNYRFGTHGWILLSAVVEAAAAEPFAAFMRREIFEPLGMTRTTLERTHQDDDVVSADSPREAPPPDYSCFAGAGAFLSTPSDLVRLGSAMLKPGLLKAETIAVLQEPLRLKSGASTGFALGWKVETSQLAGAQTQVLRHRATPFGGAISLTLFPDRQLVVAVTTHGLQLQKADAFVLQVAEAFTSGR